MYPGDTEIRFLTGELLTELGREHDALAQYRDIIDHDGDDLEVRARMLQLYNGMGNTDGMKLTVEAMLEMDPTDNTLLRILADIHIELNETDEAIGALEQAVANDAGDVEAIMALAEIYREVGRADDADRLESEYADNYEIAVSDRLATMRMQEWACLPVPWVPLKCTCDI